MLISLSAFSFVMLSITWKTLSAAAMCMSSVHVCNCAAHCTAVTDSQLLVFSSFGFLVFIANYCNINHRQENKQMCPITAYYNIFALCHFAEILWCCLDVLCHKDQFCSILCIFFGGINGKVYFLGMDCCPNQS